MQVTLSGDQIVHIVDVLAPVALAVVALVQSRRAKNAADDAHDLAAKAHSVATEAKNEQINMALRRSVAEWDSGKASFPESGPSRLEGKQ